MGHTVGGPPYPSIVCMLFCFVPAFSVGRLASSPPVAVANARQKKAHTHAESALSAVAFACSTVHALTAASHRIASHRIASHRIASHRIASHRIACSSGLQTDAAFSGSSGGSLVAATLACGVPPPLTATPPPAAPPTHTPRTHPAQPHRSLQHRRRAADGCAGCRSAY